MNTIALVAAIAGNTYISSTGGGILETGFVENRGQYPDRVLFHSIHPFGIFILSDGRIIVGNTFISFDSNPGRIRGDLMAITRFSYFSAEESISGLPTFRRVILEEIYPGIDAILTPVSGRLELQFVVKPGSDPKSIRIHVEGDGIQVKDGTVMAGSSLTISSFRAFQGSKELQIKPVVNGNVISFQVDDYDPAFTLIIDPIVTAILSGSQDDGLNAMVTDINGNILVAGYTHSDDFAPSRTVFGTSGTGDRDVFVSKISADLQTHIATAVIAGSEDEGGRAIALDNAGNVFVAGWTYSSDFAPSRTVFGTRGREDVFVTKLSGDLQNHLATAIIASSAKERANDLAIDDNGNVYVGGRTQRAKEFSSSRIIFGSSKKLDGFITKLNNNLDQHLGTAIVASTGRDAVRDLAIYSGYVFAAGEAGNSSDFAPSRTILGTPGGAEAFVSKFTSDLQSHVATAIIAGSDDDNATALAVDGAGNILVGGWTNSDDFAPSRTIFGTTSDTTDAFITILSNDLQNHVKTAILASSGWDAIRDLCITPSGDIVAAGETGNYSDFAPSRQTHGTPGGQSDAFVSRFSGDLSTHRATFIVAGSDRDKLNTVAYGPSGELYIAGTTDNSGDFSDPGNKTIHGTAGNQDAFIVSVTDLLPVRYGEDDGESQIRLMGNRISIRLTTPGYVGFDIFSPSGRLEYRNSPGYLPEGTYFFSIPLSRGLHILKVRTGDRIRTLKIVR